MNTKLLWALAFSTFMVVASVAMSGCGGLMGGALYQNSSQAVPTIAGNGRISTTNVGGIVQTSSSEMPDGRAIVRGCLDIQRDWARFLREEQGITPSQDTWLGWLQGQNLVMAAQQCMGQLNGMGNGMGNRGGFGSGMNGVGGMGGGFGSGNGFGGFGQNGYVQAPPSAGQHINANTAYDPATHMMILAANPSTRVPLVGMGMTGGVPSSAPVVSAAEGAAPQAGTGAVAGTPATRTELQAVVRRVVRDGESINGLDARVGRLERRRR